MGFNITCPECGVEKVAVIEHRLVNHDDPPTAKTCTAARTPVVRSTPPMGCDLCGEVAQLRPYGPKGEYVCFKCGMKDQPAAERAFRKRFGL